MNLKASDGAHNLRRVLWAAFLVALPVTSFPFFPRILGGTATVRPLAIYPLLVLALVIVIPQILRVGIPQPALPLIAFILIAVVGAGFAIARATPAFRGVTPFDRVLRNLITLGLGCLFYFTALMLPQSRGDLRFSVRWLLIGFSIALVWASLQALYVLNITSNYDRWIGYFRNLNELHHWISTRNLQNKRVTGMAFEPSWFAEQLTILVLPWLLSSVTQKVSVFRWKFRWVRVEHLLLVWAVGILILTFSRTGLVILFVLLGLTTLLTWFGRESSPDAGEAERRTRPSLLRHFGGAIMIFALLLILIVYFGSQNNYFARIWRFWTDANAGGSFWNYIAFGQRFIYWQAAFSIFEDFPLFGAGLGNYALLFEDHIPAVPLFQFPEILLNIVPGDGRSQLITPKNLYLRLLAETGMAGFLLYISFMLVALGGAISLWLSGEKEARFFGKAGLLSFAAVLLVAFSTDSFALPNMWVAFGLGSRAFLQYSDSRAGKSRAANE